MRRRVQKFFNRLGIAVFGLFALFALIAFIDGSNEWGFTHTALAIVSLVLFVVLGWIFSALFPD